MCSRAAHAVTVTRPRVALVSLLLCLILAACGPARSDEPAGTIRVLLVGDVMLGRSVAPVVAADPEGLFADVGWVVRGADVAMANLESPLTTRPHASPNPHALEAYPAAALLLAAAGFDVVNLANNHGGDAGPESVLDTLLAVEAAGMRPVGAGADRDDATRPTLLEVDGVTIAVLGFDATGAGMVAGDGPGITPWDPALAEKAVTEARRIADVVVVSIHGGVEYLPEADPRMVRITEQLAEWGADVVWGHGPHVAQSSMVVENGRRTAVVVTSLGNFLFDQRGPVTGGGMILEVMAGRDGIVAYRTGSTSHHDLRVHFNGWDLPDGDAALVGGEWWSLPRRPQLASERDDVAGFPWGLVVDAARGNITGGGETEVVISFRHHPDPHPARDGLPDIDWTDAHGRTAHLGIYRLEGLEPIWVAGIVPAPIADVAACDGSIAIAYSTLDEPTIIAMGAAVWRPYGLIAADRLAGAGISGCADIDGDALADPVIRRP